MERGRGAQDWRQTPWLGTGSTPLGWPLSISDPSSEMGSEPHLEVTVRPTRDVSGQEASPGSNRIPTPLLCLSFPCYRAGNVVASWRMWSAGVGVPVSRGPGPGKQQKGAPSHPLCPGHRSAARFKPNSLGSTLLSARLSSSSAQPAPHNPLARRLPWAWATRDSARRTPSSPSVAPAQPSPPPGRLPVLPRSGAKQGRSRTTVGGP